MVAIRMNQVCWDEVDDNLLMQIVRCYVHESIDC